MTTATIVDAIDLRLLAELQRDASRSNQAISEAAHVSPATGLRRIRRLTEAGIVERTIAVLSPEALGHGLTAIVEVTLDQQSAERLAAFEARAVADAGVQQCYRTNGGPDFVLIAQVADMPAYLALAKRLFTDDANVRNVRCFFSVHRAKAGLGITLPAVASQPGAGG
ncbi:MAG TPA: Lrp/AsnC family transcriptional regulator [Burkholderiaceae bacterium]|nr:Lrp/AsnC family transcriptional regulator [Burkholderiaceae bacterium]HMX12213.1 Lrp/AsnC family transcriptional regulator [Burkholderiaceae bacterium]HMY98423.1 Lrp/AsnC family transcriptional regulator [Burkholderiaceae bacterium]HNB46154.1 Lrp/AsnC family transcriptional regulator [Burkholderiaceae bacterium]HNG80138.1 Lrp/AsnC family transcriptional regulator [Burkholderiaceae bacterium]